MQVEVEKLEGLERRLKVVLEVEKVEKAYQERLKEVAKQARLDGFRPGKAPMHIIESRIGKSLRGEVASELMQSGFQQAVVDKKLKIAGSPEVKPGEIAKGKPLEFEVVYESYPEIELADFSGVKLDKVVSEITDKDVDNALEKIQKQHADWDDVKRKAKVGDRVVIDFDGYIDKKPFPGGSSKKHPLELGSHQMVDGFEEGLVGVKAGEERDVELTFPENYPVTNLANQKVLFKVVVHQVQQAKLPELDDELVKKIGVQDATNLAQLKVNIRESLEKELAQNVESLMKKRVLDKLVELNPIEMPKTMLDDEIKHLQDISRQQVAMQQGQRIDPKKINLPRDPYVPQATRRVILGLLVAELVKKHEIKVDRDRVRARIEEMCAGFPNSEEMVNYYQSNKRLSSEIEAAVLEEQVVAKLLEEAELKDQSQSFDEVFEQVRKMGSEA